MGDAYAVYDLCQHMGWTYDDYTQQPAWWVARCRLMRHAERKAEADLAAKAARGKGRS